MVLSAFVLAVALAGQWRPTARIHNSLPQSGHAGWVAEGLELVKRTGRRAPSAPGHIDRSRTCPPCALFRCASPWVGILREDSPATGAHLLWCRAELIASWAKEDFSLLGRTRSVLFALGVPRTAVGIGSTPPGIGTARPRLARARARMTTPTSHRPDRRFENTRHLARRLRCSDLPHNDKKTPRPGSRRMSMLRSPRAPMCQRIGCRTPRRKPRWEDWRKGPALRRKVIPEKPGSGQ